MQHHEAQELRIIVIIRIIRQQVKDLNCQAKAQLGILWELGVGRLELNSESF